MRLSYSCKNDADSERIIEFPLGYVDRDNTLSLGSASTCRYAQLSESQVLAILAEVVQRTNAKIRIEFEEGITLEFE